MTLQISVQRSAISLDFQHLNLLLQLDTLDVFHRLGRTEPQVLTGHSRQIRCVYWWQHWATLFSQNQDKLSKNS